ncbi:hypothetical protein QA635_19570 [Bradyrhizobium brasilense]|uniref:hypothetical protein n=1 Tax=Bradyrhizobium brasilense TaxID=1419277 RepID=UPI0024B1913E|nr:hypothetical protein [Bradyrhizobium australafricanum]WFU36492.1 hypothetical protein QA635_19570 [Bradyrhizobium australafricanum]
MTVRINVATLSASELADVREQLRTKPGGRTAETKAALAERDRLIRELARRFHSGLSRNAQAEAIHRELSRYSGSEWIRTCADETCRHRDERRALVWQILRLRGGRAPKVRLLDDILAYRTRR